MLNDLWQEAWDNQDDDANDEYCDGFRWTSLPFFQDDAPNIGEYHVECHQDAEGERQEGRRLSEESLAEWQTEELAVPQGSCQGAEHEVVAPYLRLLLIAPSMILAILVETVDGIGDETAQCHQEGGW